MNKYIIHGKQPLSGILEVNGAKNSGLIILACTLIAEGEYILHNIPDLKDVAVMLQMLESLNLKTEKIGPHDYKITNNGLETVEAPYDLVRVMRASFVVMGPLLAHKKEARVPMPGGCAIGTRPVDIHLKAFEQLGVVISNESGVIGAKADKLIGAKIDLDFPTVTGTENIIMAATKAEGETVITNAAKEPEITDLCNFLNTMGAEISGAGTEEIRIQGVEKLTPGEYTIISDRIEAGTFIIVSLIAGQDLKLKNVNLEHLSGFVVKLEEMGVEFEEEDDFVTVKGELSQLKNVNIETEPYPGFPTDLQAQTMILLSLIKGQSSVSENIFENRFMHVPELNRLGADIKIENNKAIINGLVKFAGTSVSVSDLRAGASLILAGLVANNTTTINEIQHIERGYENIVERLQAVGVNIIKE